MSIVQYPAEILKQQSSVACVGLEVNHYQARVNTELKTELAATRNTRWAHALAAVQIGHPVRAFIVDMELVGEHIEVSTSMFMKVGKDFIRDGIFWNPVVSSRGMAGSLKPESCMSLPDDVTINVFRNDFVSIRALNVDGAEFVVDCEGIAAQVMQHEMDHLNGTTLMDHASKREKKGIIQRIVKRVQIKRR